MLALEIAQGSHTLQILQLDKNNLEAVWYFVAV